MPQTINDAQVDIFNRNSGKFLRPDPVNGRDLQWMNRLKDFSDTRFAGENVDFLISLSKLDSQVDQGASDAEKEATVKVLEEVFIKTDAPQEINIKGNTRNAFTDANATLTEKVDLLRGGIREEIIQLLRLNEVTPYLRSNNFEADFDALGPDLQWDQPIAGRDRFNDPFDRLRGAEEQEARVRSNARVNDGNGVNDEINPDDFGVPDQQGAARVNPEPNDGFEEPRLEEPEENPLEELGGLEL